MVEGALSLALQCSLCRPVLIFPSACGPAQRLPFTLCTAGSAWEGAARARPHAAVRIRPASFRPPPGVWRCFTACLHHLSIEMEGSHTCMQEERCRQGALSCCERGPAWCVHVRRPSSAHPRPLNAMSADTVQWVVQTLEKASPWRLRSCRAAQCKRFGP